MRPGKIVGLYGCRGDWLLVMQLAIAKAGAAWLPFDADVPTNRIAVYVWRTPAPPGWWCTATGPRNWSASPMQMGTC